MQTIHCNEQKEADENKKMVFVSRSFQGSTHLLFVIPQPDASLYCEVTFMGLMHCVLQLSLLVICLSTEGWLEMVHPSAHSHSAN